MSRQPGDVDQVMGDVARTFPETSPQVLDQLRASLTGGACIKDAIVRAYSSGGRASPMLSVMLRNRVPDCAQ